MALIKYLLGQEIKIVTRDSEGRKNVEYRPVEGEQSTEDLTRVLSEELVGNHSAYGISVGYKGHTVSIKSR